MLALSVRQPWAWIIIHGGKDIENRSWRTNIRGRILIHASKSMEYGDEEAAEMCQEFGVEPPTTFERGGVIGSVEIVDCVTAHDSPWFAGDYGFVLRAPEPLPFTAYQGRVGFFEVAVDAAGQVVGGTVPPVRETARKPTKPRAARRRVDDYPIPGFDSWEDYNQAMKAYKEGQAAAEPEEKS